MENEIRKVHFSEYGVDSELVLKVPCHFLLLNDYAKFFNHITLSLPINSYVYISASRRTDGTCKFFYQTLKERKKGAVATSRFRKEDKWSNNIKAVITGFCFNEMNFSGFDMTITSELLPADGIGVDNALHIATALVLKQFFYPDITDEKLIECVAHGLMIFFGSFISYADIFTPFYAKKDSCVISNLAAKTYEVVPFFENSTIVIVDSRIPGMEYWNENSIYAPANADLLSKLKIIQNGKQVYVDLRSDKASLLLEADEEVRRCVSGIIKEASYTANAIRAVKAGDHSVFAREVNRSNELFSDAFLFSRPEVDWIVKRSHEFDQPAGKATFACARMIGKKFGRYVVTIMSDEFLDTYKEKIAEYEKIFGFSPLCRVFKPGDGYEIIWTKD